MLEVAGDISCPTDERVKIELKDKLKDGLPDWKMDEVKGLIKEISISKRQNIIDEVSKNNKDTKQKLESLARELEKVEVQCEVEKEKTNEVQKEVQPISMETFKNKITSPTMNMMLSWENLPDSIKEYWAKSVFDLFADQKLLKTVNELWVKNQSELLPFYKNKDSIKIIFWKKLIEAFDGISISSATNSLISSVNKKWEKLDLGSLKKAFEDLEDFSEKIKDWENLWEITFLKLPNFEENKIQVPYSIKILSQQIEKIVEEQTINLKKLFNSAKWKNTLNDKWFENILANPEALEKILNWEEYIWNGFKINLSNNSFEKQESPIDLDTKKSQEEFIENLARETDKIWKPIDELRSNAQKLSETVKKITWYDIDDLKDIIENLKKSSPFLWWIISFIFNIFFGVLPETKNNKETVWELPPEDVRKTSIKNLVKFKESDSKKIIPENFDLWKPENENKDFEKLNWFFWTINNSEEQRIKNLPENQEKNKSNEIIKDPNLWKNLLWNWENLEEWSTLKKLNKAIKKQILEKTPKIEKWENFLNELNNLKIEEDKTEEKSETPNNWVKTWTVAWATLTANTSNEKQTLETKWLDSATDKQNGLEKQSEIPSYEEIISKHWEEINKLSSKTSENPKWILKESPDKEKIALTFDICSCYTWDKKQNVLDTLDLISKNKYPVTIFITGSALEDNEIKEKIKEVSKLPYVSIWAHWLHHFATTSESKEYFYKSEKFKWIPWTWSLEEAYKEIKLSSDKIFEITWERPKYFRSASLFTDEQVVKMLEYMWMKMVWRTDENKWTEKNKNLQSDDWGGWKKWNINEMNFKKWVLFLWHATNYKWVEAIYKELKNKKIETTLLDNKIEEK